MVSAGGLTFQEYAVCEPLPLSALHAAILDFLRRRDDAVVLGALAVNAYVSEPRMTQDAGIMSTDARRLAEELRAHLSRRFHIAARVREVAGGRGRRVYQVQKTGNRHLADIRPVRERPPSQPINGVPVIDVVGLIASKVASAAGRQGSAKGLTDLRDLGRLFEAYPELKRDPGPVTDRLVGEGAGEATLAAWRDLVAQEFRRESAEDEFTW